MTDAREVVVVGGGIAGIEALMALADLGDNRLRLHLVGDRPDFVLPRESLGLPWGEPMLHIDLEVTARAFGARFTRASVVGVDAVAREVFTASGATIDYERLLLAPGATPCFAYPGVPTLGFGELPVELTSMGSVALIVPDETTWTLPAYQLALMAAGGGRDVRVLTGEPHPLAAFGLGVREAMSAFLDHHGVTIGSAPEPSASVKGLAHTVVALPRLTGPGIAGIPITPEGFVRVGQRGTVPGFTDVFVAGDATHHAIKQGGLAAQQADLAAVEIVRSCGGSPPTVPYAPILRGKLVGGDHDELYLRRALDGIDRGRTSPHPLWRPAGAVCAWRLARWLSFHRQDLHGPRPAGADVVDVTDERSRLVGDRGSQR